MTLGDFPAGKNNFYLMFCKNHMLLLSGILWLSLSPVASAKTSEQGGFTTISYQEEQGEYDGHLDSTSNDTLYQQDEPTQMAKRMATSPEGYTTTSYQEQQEEDDAHDDHTSPSTNHQQDDYPMNRVSMVGSSTDSYQEDKKCVCSQCVPREQKPIVMDSVMDSWEMWIMCGIALQCILLVWLSFVLGIALHEAKK